VKYIEHYPRDAKENIMKNILMLVYIFLGKRVTHVVPAFPLTLKQQYGGLWDDDRYNSEMARINPNQEMTTSIIPERDRTQSYKKEEIKQDGYTLIDFTSS
jgi:hypothetical protein